MTNIPQLDEITKQQEGSPEIEFGFLWKRGHWLLPDGATHVYVLASWSCITLAMLRDALRRGLVSLTVRFGPGWVEIPLALFRRTAAFRHLLRRLTRPLYNYAITVAPALLQRSSSSNLPFSSSMLTSMIASAHECPTDEFVPGRIVLVCGNLSPGGAERQVVYTAKGLASSRKVESVRVLCDLLTANHSERYDFHLPLLSQSGIEAYVPARRAIERAMVAEPTALAAVRASFPEGLLVDVANLYHELVRLRPEVVHAWLDWSNIRAGLAAALAGVPRIVLSGRNLNPTNFLFYQPYMKPVYETLCTLPNVVLLNNSSAGAASYAEWLDIPLSQFRVIHNGLDTARRPAHSAEVRKSLGIPPNVPLIGGVFRFSPEKRPLLWLEVAARVYRSRPDAWFVIFGQGILKAKMENRASSLGIADRLLLPGVVEDALSAIGAMDIFLLTSSGEGLPNVLLEAQWVGTPIVATAAGGVSEAIEPGTTGWIVDPSDPVLLAERIVALLADQEARLRARYCGPLSVERRFAIDHMITETLEAYRMIGPTEG